MQFSWLSRARIKAALAKVTADIEIAKISGRLFLILFAVDVSLRVLWLDKPAGSLIFDEYYYVNVARVILGLPQSPGSNGQPPYVDAMPGIDPNHEHPPLAKLLMALSMHFLGNDAYAWRIPSVIAGSLSILFFYLLMKRISAHPSIPLLATFLFSFDNLVFVHSRIATLDIYFVAFMIAGFYLYVAEHNYLSALCLALSTLSKDTGALGLLTIVVFHTVRFMVKRSRPIAWNQLLRWFERYLGAYLLSFFLILTFLDRYWGGYSNPLLHIQFMANYATSLVSACPNGIISCPWQWLINQIQIPYLNVSVKVTSDNSTREFLSVAFTGAMNPAILYLALPSMFYCGYKFIKKRSEFSLLMLIWFAATYLPYYPGVILDHRVTYIFYFLPSIPPVCAAVADMIVDHNPPRLVVLFYLGAVLASFYIMFPFKVIPS